VLAACGARLGAVNDLNEHGAVREKVLKPYLRSIGADESGQFPLPRYHDIKFDPTFGARVLKHLGGADCYKDAKIALVWLLWVEHFPDARWVIVRRDPDDIAASCMRTRFMRAYKTHQEWVWWAQEYHDRCDALMQAVGDKAINVWPHEAIKGDTEAYRAAVEHAGLSWNADAVRSVVQPSRWHA
jgi:hypothetical protein